MPKMSKNNFIIIIDMSSGSLISSLFRDNSFSSRSCSMFHKTLLGDGSKQQRARSQSTYIDKNVNSSSTNLYLPVARMAHTLAVKVKKLNYFLFCRLQANLKKCRVNSATAIQNSQIQKNIVQNHQQSIETNISLSNVENNKKQKIGKGLQSISEFLQLKQLKAQNSTKIQDSFKKIKKYSIAKCSAGKICQILEKRFNNNISQCFKKIQNYQKFILKAQIFTQANVHIIQPKIKNVFKSIRDFAIQNKIKQEVQDRQKKSKQLQNQRKKHQKFVNLQGIYMGSVNQRLKSISQQGSSIFSEQQTAKYSTPQKGSNKSRHDLQKSKTSRKQSKNLVLMKKQTKKQFYQQPQLPQNSKSKIKSKIPIDYENQEFNKMHMRSSTKKQSNRPRINILKSYRVQTSMIDKYTIQLNPNLRQQNQQKCMLKHNRMYSQNISQPLPDLHDNMGVFQSLNSQQLGSILVVEDCQMHSTRTVQKLKNSCPLSDIHKTVNQCKVEVDVQVADQLRDDDISIDRNTDNGNYMKQSSKAVSTINSNSRAMITSYSSPRFCQTAINTSIRFDQTQNRQIHSNNQFYSSPLEKIEEMILDLEKIRERQKFNSKYTTSHHKYKIAVNLPKKSCEGRSYQNSATKINNHRTLIQQCRSQKKDSFSTLNRYSQKQPQKQQKQNSQIKIWDQKQRFLFYAQKKHAKQRKSTNLISSMNQSQLNTARKMKKQIQNIIKSRKSRTSLGNLKLVRTKN